MDRRIVRGVATSVAALGFTAIIGGGIAFAHIDADPAAVEAGAAATVAFNLEHGCNGSPTTGLDIQVPGSISDATPVAKDGWTAEVDGGVIRFSGGSIDAATPDTFSITFTAPTTPGTINFPIVQTCAEGSTDWLDIAVEGQPEPEHPAASLTITDGPPTAEDLAPHDDAASTDATATSGVTTTATSASPDDDSNTALIVVVVLVAVVVVGAGGYVATRSRRNRSSK